MNTFTEVRLVERNAIADSAKCNDHLYKSFIVNYVFESLLAGQLSLVMDKYDKAYVGHILAVRDATVDSIFVQSTKKLNALMDDEGLNASKMNDICNNALAVRNAANKVILGILK